MSVKTLYDRSKDGVVRGESARLRPMWAGFESVPGLGVICGLSLLSELALRVFLWVLRFSSFNKSTLLNRPFPSCPLFQTSLRVNPFM